MNFKGIFLIGILAFSFLAISFDNVNAAKVDIDGNWRIVQQYTLTDMSTGERIFQRDVAGGTAHTVDIGNDHLYHQLLIELSYKTASSVDPNYHRILVNMYDSKDIKLFGRYKYDTRKVKYWTYLKYEVNGFKDETNGNVVI